MEYWVSKCIKGVWSWIFWKIFKNVFWDPLGPLYKQNENFTYEVLGKKVVWSSFLKEFLETIQKLRFLFWNFGKRSYFKTFFRHSTHKNATFVKNFRIEYVYVIHIYIYKHILLLNFWQNFHISIYPKKLHFAAYGQFVLVFLCYLNFLCCMYKYRIRKKLLSNVYIYEFEG